MDASAIETWMPSLVNTTNDGINAFMYFAIPFICIEKTSLVYWKAHFRMMKQIRPKCPSFNTSSSEPPDIEIWMPSLVNTTNDGINAFMYFAIPFVCIEKTSLVYWKAHLLQIIEGILGKVALI